MGEQVQATGLVRSVFSLQSATSATIATLRLVLAVFCCGMLTGTFAKALSPKDSSLPRPALMGEKQAGMLGASGARSWTIEFHKDVDGAWKVGDVKAAH